MENSLPYTRSLKEIRAVFPLPALGVVFITFNNDVQHQIEILNNQISFRKIQTIYFGF